jgi:hypothetical protein
MQNWDPARVDVIVGGFTMSGFADGSMIEFEEDGPRYKVVKGVDGQVTRVKINGRVGTLTIHLMNSSKSNDVLSTLHQVDINTDGGGGVVPGLVRDRNGVSLLAIPTGFIEGFPKIAMTDKPEDQPWKFICVDYQLFLGGST